jgi:hypothetical protein
LFWLLFLCFLCFILAKKSQKLLQSAIRNSTGLVCKINIYVCWPTSCHNTAKNIKVVGNIFMCSRGV